MGKKVDLNQVVVGTSFIYVDPNRTDIYTEDGSFIRPYKTFQDAVSNSGNYAAFFLNPGNYTGADITFDTGNVVVQGSGREAVTLNFSLLSDTGLQFISGFGFSLASGNDLDLSSSVSGVSLDLVKILGGNLKLNSTAILRHCQFEHNSGSVSNILVEDGEVELTSCVVNQTGNYFAIKHKYGRLSLNDCRITGNSVTDVISSTEASSATARSVLIDGGLCTNPLGPSITINNNAIIGDPNKIQNCVVVGTVTCGTAYTKVSGLITSSTVAGDNLIGESSDRITDISGVTSGGTLTQALEAIQSAKLNAIEKGADNGVATLDGDGLIPVTQLPTSAKVDFITELNDVPGDYGQPGELNMLISDGDTGTAWYLLSTTNIPEGNNLYYTDGRFDTRFGTKSTTGLGEGDNLYYTETRVDGRFDIKFGAESTTNLSEGDNLYYTETRVDGRINSSTLSALSGISENTDTENQVLITGETGENGLAWVTLDTDSVAEGSNKYYSVSLFSTDFQNSSISDLADVTGTPADGNILVFATGDPDGSAWTDPNTIIDGRISSTSIKALSDTPADYGDPGDILVSDGSTGVAFTDPNTIIDGRFDTKFGAETTDNLTEGSTNKYATQTSINNLLSTSAITYFPDFPENHGNNGEILVTNGSGLSYSTVNTALGSGTVESLSNFPSFGSNGTMLISNGSGMAWTDPTATIEGVYDSKFATSLIEGLSNVDPSVALEVSSFGITKTLHSAQTTNPSTGHYAFDADTGTSWNGVLSGGVVLAVDLGRAEVITGVTIHDTNSTGVKQFDFRGSNSDDFQGGVDNFLINVIKSEDSEPATFTFSNTSAYRYYQLWVDSTYGSVPARVTEMGLLKKGDQALFLSADGSKVVTRPISNNDINAASLTDLSDTPVDYGISGNILVSDGSTGVSFSDPNTIIDGRFDTKIAQTNITTLLDTPVDYGSDGEVLTSTGSGLAWEAIPSGVTTFDALQDIPVGYGDENDILMSDGSTGLAYQPMNTALSTGTVESLSNFPSFGSNGTMLISNGSGMAWNTVNTALATGTVESLSNFPAFGANGTILISNGSGMSWEDPVETIISSASITDLADTPGDLGTDTYVLATDGLSGTYWTAQSGGGVTSVNGDSGPSVTLTTTNLSEGTNLYYTDGRVDTRFGTKSTTDLSEGTNLYYTDGRVDTRIQNTSITSLSDTVSTLNDSGAENRVDILTDSGAGVSASRTDSGTQAGYSFNGNTSNYWEAIDTGDGEAISYYNLTSVVATGVSLHTKAGYEIGNFNFYGAPNTTSWSGTGWVLLGSGNNAVGDTDEYFFFDNNTSYGSYKLEFVKNGTVRLASIKVYKTPADNVMVIDSTADSVESKSIESLIEDNIFNPITTTYDSVGNIAVGDYVVFSDPDSSQVSLTLPSPVDYPGARYFVKNVNTGTNRVSLAGSGGNIEGGTVTLYPDESVTVQSDGANYKIVSRDLPYNIKKYISTTNPVDVRNNVILGNPSGSDITLTLPSYSSFQESIPVVIKNIATTKSVIVSCPTDIDGNSGDITLKPQEVIKIQREGNFLRNISKFQISHSSITDLVDTPGTYGTNGDILVSDGSTGVSFSDPNTIIDGRIAVSSVTDLLDTPSDFLDDVRDIGIVPAIVPNATPFTTNPEYAIEDDVLSTESTQGSGNIDVDLGYKHIVKSITLYDDNSDGIQDFTLQGSHNSDMSSPANLISSTKTQSSSPETFSVGSPDFYRYYRLNVTNTYSGNARITDIKFLAGRANSTLRLDSTASNVSFTDTSFGGTRTVDSSVTTTDTVTSADNTIFYDTATAAIIATLPDPTNVPNQIFRLKKIDDTNPVTVQVSGGGLIDGTSTVELGLKSASIAVHSDGVMYRGIQKQLPSPRYGKFRKERFLSSGQVDFIGPDDYIIMADTERRDDGQGTEGLQGAEIGYLDLPNAAVSKHQLFIVKKLHSDGNIYIRPESGSGAKIDGEDDKQIGGAEALELVSDGTDWWMIRFT